MSQGVEASSIASTGMWDTITTNVSYAGEKVVEWGKYLVAKIGEGFSWIADLCAKAWANIQPMLEQAWTFVSNNPSTMLIGLGVVGVGVLAVWGGKKLWNYCRPVAQQPAVTPPAQPANGLQRV